MHAPSGGAVEAQGFGVTPGEDGEGCPSIAAVFQDPMLVDARLHAVISLVDLDLTAGLPDGLETLVGERGGNLSVGQQQRIALMRALYRRPDVLVADEPTSALDGQVEQRICAALQAVKEHSAVILFLHRLSTVSFADSVVVLGKGVVQEEGSPKALAQRGGEFTRLLASETEG